MANIFEQVILASQSGTALTESKKVNKVGVKKKLKESTEPTKLVEEDIEYEDIDMDKAVDDEVVEDEVLTIVDPDLSVEEYEEAVEAQEVATESGDSVLFSDEHIDDTVMTCPICGANYFEEELDPENMTCPVCGSEREPVVLGTVEVPDEIENAVVVTAEENEVEEVVDEEIEEDADELIDDDEEEYEAVNDVEYEEEVVESFKRKNTGKSRITESDTLSLKKPEVSNRKVGVRKPSVFFEDRAMNALLNRFLIENYEGKCLAKVERAISRGKNLILECKITQKDHKPRSTKFITENYEGLKTKKLEFREEGLFTESNDKSKSFIVECVCKGRSIVPMSMRYKYRVVEDKKTYQVEGRCLLESKKRK